MSDDITRQFIETYTQESEPTMFLTQMTQSPPRNFHSSEEVEFDIVRSDEEIAVVVQDLSTGYRMNSNDIYTNKAFRPPILKEAIPINAFDLIKRQYGQDPFQSPDFRANLMMRMFSGMREVERKIRRHVEVQASQVMQTGQLSLVNAAANALYTLNFAPKASHFPQVTTSWSAGGATPLDDLASLATVIRDDGLMDSDMVVMGNAAFRNFIRNTTVQAHFDNRRINQGDIVPMQFRNGGGQFRGEVDIDNYKFQVWTYNGRYNPPQGGTKVPYVGANNVIMKSMDTRIDATFGAIPNIGREIGANTAAASLLPEMPGRISDGQQRMDMFTNVWMSADGEQLFGGIGARPLVIPTAIDQFGTLNTVAP